MSDMLDRIRGGEAHRGHGGRNDDGPGIIGRTRKPSFPRKGAVDDTDRMLRSLAEVPQVRRDLRKQIQRQHGISHRDVERVKAIRGRPSKELAPLRRKVGRVFAEMVECEKPVTQHGRRVARRSLMLLYGLSELQLNRLITAGRAESDTPMYRGGEGPTSRKESR